jgi:hypothetical protein
MKRGPFLVGALLLLSCGGGGAGGKYYLVRDLSGGRIYYTSDLRKQEETGYATFTDAKTREQVTLPVYSAEPITKDEYKANVAR